MRALLLLLLTAMLWAGAAQAHLMPAQQGTLKLQDKAVFVAVAMPVSALAGVDDDGDGRLSDAELLRHARAIDAQIASRWQLTGDGQPGVQALLQVLPQPDDDAPGAGSRHLLVLMKTAFAAAPQALRVQTDLYGTAAEERQLTLKALRTVAGALQTEAVVLTPLRTGHAFFRSPWQVLGDYLALGAEHILLGTDHLLFLLTLIVAGAGWRYWGAVLTSFTVAHSLSMTAALLGWVQVSASVVEPLIAASIVLMAALNLWQRKVRTGQRAAVVLACGLLHGLGFASAMADMGLSGDNRLASVLGFNLGIELGQALFVASVLGVLAAARGLSPLRGPRGRWQPAQAHAGSFASSLTAAQITSLAALLMGSFWLLKRVGG